MTTRPGGRSSDGNGPSLATGPERRASLSLLTILKSDLLAAGGFEDARIVRQPMAGNPTLLTDDEWDVIESLR